MFGTGNPHMALLSRLRENTRGAVAIIGALSLTSMVGMGAVAVEATRGYSAKVSNQRIADAAALAGALAYNVNNNSTQMTATAKAVVAAQGLNANTANVQLVTEGSKQLVQVTITTVVPLVLGKVLTGDLSYDVASVGMATATTLSASPPCIAAINGSPTNSITMNGGTILRAPGCAVNSAAGVSVIEGAEIKTASQVNSGKAITIAGGAKIITEPTPDNKVQNKANAASDWMKDSPALKEILCQVNKLTLVSDADYADGNTNCVSLLVAPAAVPGSAQNLSLNYSPSGQLATYFNGSNNSYTIPASYITSAFGNNIKNLTIQGGLTVTFQGPLTLNVASIAMNGTALHFGSGNVSIGSMSINGGALVDFDVAAGNNITIGASGATAVNLGGGSKLCFTLNCVAPTAASGTFSVGGNIITAGGSTIVFPRATNHVINGNLSLSGSSTFGSGNYIIKGNFINNTGGTMAGIDVTFALGGTFTLSGGTALDLAAPGALSSYGIPGILFATKSASATTITGGSNGKYAGLLYAPKSDLTISGGGSISTNGAACLMIIAKTLSLLQGGTVSTGTCAGLAAPSSTTAAVALYK